MALYSGSKSTPGAHVTNGIEKEVERMSLDSFWIVYNKGRGTEIEKEIEPITMGDIV